MYFFSFDVLGIFFSILKYLCYSAIPDQNIISFGEQDSNFRPLLGPQPTPSTSASLAMSLVEQFCILVPLGYPIYYLLYLLISHST